MIISTRARRLAVASAAAALVAGTLAGAPAAQAAPVFTQSQLTSSFFGHSDGGCSTDSETGSTPVDLPVTENGPAVSATQTVNAQVSNAGDSQTANASATGTGAVSSVGTNLKELSFEVNGQYSVTQTQPVSACQIHFGASLELNAEFLVTQPGFLNINVKNKGKGTYTEFYLTMVSPVSSPYYDQYSQGMEFDASTRIYLPAGTYQAYADTEIGADDVTVATPTVNASGSVKATFSPIGSQTEAATGKGSRFVNLPATARDCATDTVTGSITNNRKRAKLIKKVKFFVNGALKKTVKEPGRGEIVALTGISDGVAADVRAVVKLVKKANGKKRDAKEVTASYEACAPSS